MRLIRAKLALLAVLARRIHVEDAGALLLVLTREKRCAAMPTGPRGYCEGFACVGISIRLVAGEIDDDITG